MGGALRARHCQPASEAVAKVVYSPNALEKMESALASLRDKNPATALAAAEAIRSAIENLATHPLIGRKVSDDVRELVISYGATGYIALYRFVVLRDEVRILALRHQREIGYLP